MYPNALGAASRILGREARIETLPDVALALQTYLPWGSGMGTFVPVFNAAESLDNVGSRFFNHAHDDYLELLIEAGIGALLALATFFGWLAWRWFRLERMPLGEKSHTSVQRLAIAAIGILCVHSLLDYPLRTTTLLSIFALWGSLLALKRPFDDDRRRRSRR
jgi:O-antigen ligase